MTFVKKVAKTVWKDCKKHIKFGYSFSRNSENDKKIPDSVKGIYIITPKGVKPKIGKCLYVGETFAKSKNVGINSRLKSHKKSLIDPTWITENTGKKFLQAGISLDIEMDVWYIDASEIGINDKQSSRAIEQFIQKHLKPKVWNIK